MESSAVGEEHFLIEESGISVDRGSEEEGSVAAGRSARGRRALACAVGAAVLYGIALWKTHSGSVEVRADAPVEFSSVQCAMARKGSECYENVVWAMTQGIREHPEWYPHLSTTSLFEDFQRHLSEFGKVGCPEPCPSPVGCETAAPDSKCAEHITWIATVGLEKKPEWYQGLTTHSPPEMFQNHVHLTEPRVCPTAACNVQPFKVVSLFCWMVVRPDGYELPLVQAQLEKKAGTFACDDFVLVSSQALDFVGVETLLIPTTMASGYTKDGTSPNALIFVNAWDRIKAEGRYLRHDWVVKCDPDTVFLPSRLRALLAPGQQPDNPYPPPFKAHPGRGQWVTNCDAMKGWGQTSWGHGWPMMYGAVEVLSRDALTAYFDNLDVCKGLGDWRSLGEDAFMGICMRKLKVGEVFLPQDDLKCTNVQPDCKDAKFAAFHPKKDIASWMACWNQATR